MIYFQLARSDGEMFSLSFQCDYVDVDNIYTIAIYKNELDSAFSGEFQTCYAKFKGVVFIPNRTLEVASRLVGDNHKFFLCINSVELVEVDENSGKTPYIIDIFNRGDVEQPDWLIKDVSTMTDTLKSKVELDLCVIYGTEIKRHSFLLKNWFDYFRQNFDMESIFYVTYTIDEKSDLINSKRQVHLNGIDSVKGIMYDVELERNIPCLTTMKFEVKPSRQAVQAENIRLLIPNVKMSFSAPLTDIGKRTVRRVKSQLQEKRQLCSTDSTQYIAPMVALCQSSGSGKSKIAIEICQQNPGFYIVFRGEDQTGFPFKNSLSKDFESIIRNYKDLNTDQSENSFETSTIGVILDFIYRSVKLSLQKIFFRVRSNCKSNDSDDKIKDEISTAVLEFGRLFLSNDKNSSQLTLPTVEDSLKDYKWHFKKSSIYVGVVSRAITVLLTEADEFIGNDGNFKQLDAKVSVALKNDFLKFPFLYVVDEADLLANHEFEQLIASGSSSKSRIFNGLEVFRRALSYISPEAPIIFMTLGTKSDVSVLNPPVIDISARLIRRTLFLPPIVLSSNSNIFSLKYPIHKLVPTHSLLRNPLMMKFLTTLGHGLWGNYPFDSVVSMAESKIVNGSGGKKTFLIPVWLTRTGLTAKPVFPARKLVSNHMASLLSISDDLMDLVVNYPSEPVIAMACKRLTNALSSSEDDVLFAHLKNHLEWVSIDSGKYSETFSKMMVLLNLDKCTDVANHSQEKYDDLLSEITAACPDLKELWETKSFLLESRSKDAENIVGSARTRFDDYAVHTVGDFLKRWLHREGESEVNLESLGLPDMILKGIVNATHFVPLVRDSRGFSCGNLKIEPRKLPLADTRLEDISRNVIDRSLLQLGLVRQCGFSLPDSYFGTDFIIPVCLENGTYTFLSFQVKKSTTGLQEDIFKMRARLHYVNSDQLPSEDLNAIYENQVSFLIALSQEDSERIPVFRNSSTMYYEDFMLRPAITDVEKAVMRVELSNDKTVLKNALSGDLSATEELKLSKSAPKSKYWFYPLIHQKLKLRGDILLSKALWNDPLTENPGLLESDRFVHRQFCFVTRGWGNLHGLVGKNDSSAQMAKDILSGLVGPFKRSAQGSECSSNIIRAAVYDVGPTYMEYSEELLFFRFGGTSSNLNAIDISTKCLDSPPDPVTEQTDSKRQKRK